MYIGLDVGGTNLVAGLVDREGKILHKAACPVDRSWTAEELSARLARLARQAAEEGGCPVSQLQAAGGAARPGGQPGGRGGQNAQYALSEHPAPGSVPAGAGTAPLSGQRR